MNKQETPRSEAVEIARNYAIKTLEAAGVLDAARYVEQELKLAMMPEYTPDQQEARALVGLDTIVLLNTRQWGTVNETKPEPIDFSLARIAADIVSAIQIRVDGIDPNRATDYASAMLAGDQFPPVVIFYDRGADRALLADGFHRYQAAVRAGHYTIQAEVYAGTQDDAMEYAATCNARHGMPMSNADKRAAAGRLLTLHPDWSSREIGKRVGCSHTFVDKVRKEHDVSGNGCQIEQPQARTVTRGDQTYTYTPPTGTGVPAATVWQIENCIRNYLNGRFGHRLDESLAERVKLLQVFKRNRALPADVHLPDRYDKDDVRKAVNNVLEQCIQRQRVIEHLAGGEEAQDQTSEGPAEYADVVTIENCIAKYIGDKIGYGQSEELLAQQLTILADIADDYYALPADLELPEPYRKADLNTAAHNLIDRKSEIQRQLYGTATPEPEEETTETEKQTTPDQQPEYATVNELRDAFDFYMDSLFGRDGLRVKRLKYLEQIKIDEYQVPAQFGYRTSWLRGSWIQAIDDLIYKYRALITLDPPKARVVTFDPSPQDPTTFEPWLNIKMLLLNGYHEELRDYLPGAEFSDFEQALCSVFAPPMRDRGARATQTLLDAIFQPWPDPEPAPPVVEAQDSIACPECGGDVIISHLDGKSSLICAECGSVLEPVL